ncbi:dihydrofolate reductase [Mortierella sp. AM989]|nr:dihydrofolate reductase [Mortierella sp. AM989]
MRSFSIVVAADLANGIGLNGGLPWRLRKDMAFFAKITSKVINNNNQQHHQPLKHLNACIMGRRTWESIPTKFRPLISRFNVIVSRNPHYLDDKPEKNNPLVALAPSLEAALDLIESLQPSSSDSSQSSSLSAAAMAAASILPSPLPLVPETPVVTSTSSITPKIHIDRIFLIGGAQLYDQGVSSKDCHHIFLTRIHTTVDCDTFFPKLSESEYKLLSSSESHAFLEQYLQEPVEGGIIEEAGFNYEYTVYNRI